ncbi:ankyrin repeat domain-containing protein [Sphingomonas bacterium]|uniref:ankyrin repeat domain-containing protein n=1 Tax=Sphingomonas bacterium TaxID=1895847 RepID=UPI0015757A94|nr:ankyrin repeat domain-containing protein [Sphingomonas bacterium]
MSLRRPLLIAAFLVAATPALAQLSGSPGYKFLEAVRGAKGDEVIATLAKPGATIINTRDGTTGEGALHIVVKRGDATYLRYLLQMGADPNLRDDKGTTPLLLAVTQGEVDLIPILTDARANPNIGNSAGETPLIRAVQRRDVTMVRALLSVGADPDQTDVIAGQSARDYATRDPRNTAVARILADTPKKAKRAVAGPKF